MHTRTYFKSFSIFIFCFLFVAVVYTQTLEEKIDQLLEAKYKPNEPGATALISINGKVI